MLTYGGYPYAGTCNLGYGGTLQTGTISCSGPANFNWNDGTIRNLDANTDLSIYSYSASLALKIAATGTHAFYIDSGRSGTVSAYLEDATTGGSLTKQGAGLLTLSGYNSYSGSTTITAGTLALINWSSLASSLIDVQSGATFDVSARRGGFTLDIGKTLKGSGTIVGNLIIKGNHAPGNSPGIETVKGNYSMLGQLNIELAGTTAGTGYDQVLLPLNGSTNYNATLSGTLSLDWTGLSGSTDTTKLWILENDTTGTLSGAFKNYVNGASLGNHDGRDWFLWYGADAATGNTTGGNDVLIASVPEPSTIIMLTLALGGLLWWRRRIE
jgi:autotransporter-associated beta strand protein